MIAIRILLMVKIEKRQLADFKAIEQTQNLRESYRTFSRKGNGVASNFCCEMELRRGKK
jgi:hypothetical protein